MHHFIIIRGPSGSGKSTLARGIQLNLERKTAIFCPDYFYWDVCGGEDTNSFIVYESLYRLSDLYLSQQYHVILEGILSSREEEGALRLERFLEMAKTHNIIPKMFYLNLPLAMALKRNQKRELRLSQETTTAHWEKSQGSRHPAEREIDARKSTDEVLTSILELL